MGATKLLAERLISSAYYSQGAQKTTFCAVRFGNVMGSRGSVIPLFREQILNSRKVTITDPSMTRFMMSCGEAANLTMHAASIAKYGEIFVLKMPTLRVGDLADSVINLTCEKYDLNKSNVSTDVIGLRPGEKMYEELMTEEEAEFAFDLEKTYMIPPHNFYERYIEAAPHIIKAPKRIYSSKDSAPLTRDKIELLLRSQKLI
jgi:FlaA1/EpsC-like NDP-sugar epimerase